ALYPDHKPLGCKHRRQLGLEDLERHLAVVLQVLGEVDRGHAALAKLAFNTVAIVERGLQALGGFRHSTKGADACGATARLARFRRPGLRERSNARHAQSRCANYVLIASSRRTVSPA